MYFLSASILSVVLAGSALYGQDTQSLTLNHKLQIPGATLKPGEYVFSVEDRLEDRAIIRITNQKKNTHELVLAVPSDKLNQPEHGKLIFFSTTDPDRQILHGWMCPNCQSALEVVYPKGEAVKITGESAKPVMAVDPTYDKLPKNLSPDDMKVVTLWLLSPKEVTPEQKGKGVEAAKYADVRKAQNLQASAAPPLSTTNVPVTDAETKKAWDRAVAPPPPGVRATTNSNASTPTSDTAASTDSSSSSAITAAAPVKTPDAAPAGADHSLMDDRTSAVPVADAAPTAARKLSEPIKVASTRRMPHTASNTYTFGLVGLALLSAGMASYLQRRFFSTLAKVRA